MKLIRTMMEIQVVIPAYSHVHAADVDRLLQVAGQNKLNILNAALVVESQLAAIISFYFFGKAGERKSVFDEFILHSDICTFSAKRKLITHILNEQQWLNGSEKGDFDQNLKRVISLRNAFAHGKLSSDGKIVWLSYFEGGPKKKELTDTYFTEAETTLALANHTCLKLQKQIGIVKDLVIGENTP